MDKLFPPILDSKLPAFADVLTINFTMNQAVSLAEISGISILVKTAQSGKQLGTLSVTGTPLYDSNTGQYVISCTDFNDIGFVNGQYYKIQIAYIKKISGMIGYYSSAGIIKKTTYPTLELPSLTNNLFNVYDYTGKYSQEGKDTTEKLYSFRFDIYDSTDNLIDTSGEIIYNSENDTSSCESTTTWENTTSLKNYTPYYVVYTVTTVNGLKASKRQSIFLNTSIDMNLDIEIYSKVDRDEGVVQIYMQSSNENRQTLTGNFILVRSSSLNDFNSWEKVYSFSYLNMVVDSENPRLLWEDYSVQQGVQYLYALQAYNQHGLYSNRLNVKNNKIQVDFEHCYLNDSDHQLKIAFNPKISTFKENVLEAKVDTIGGKYPFIFRNGNVKYKEFSISGLISLLTDPQKKFFKHKKETLIEDYENGIGMNLSAENIYAEREFKTEVLKWLNNGKPKIFRSPTEGNFIVRLMNVSLTPEDTLGRMLHTFSCTAYEIGDLTFQNLIKFNLIDNSIDKHMVLKIGQVFPKDIIQSYNDDTLSIKYPGFQVLDNNKIIFPQSYAINLTEGTPGTQYLLTFSNNTSASIEIGGTGAYYVHIAKQPSDINNVYFHSIQPINNSRWDEIKITFEYYDYAPSGIFGDINNIVLTDEIRRFVGPGYNINLAVSTEDISSKNDILADIRRDVGPFYFIRVEKRYIQNIWPIGTEFAMNETKTDIIKDTDWNPVILYYNVETREYYDGHPSVKLGLSVDFRFCLNDNDYDFSDFGGRKVLENGTVSYGNTFGRIDAIRDVDEITNLRAGNGLLLDVGYQVKTKEFVVEEQIAAIQYAKRAWLQSQSDLLRLLKGQKFEHVMVNSETYNPTIHYYFDIDAKDYILGTDQQFRDTRSYFILTSMSSVPTEEEIKNATGLMNTNYLTYIAALKMGLNNQNRKEV